MPSRNAFSGLEALLDTVPSRGGSGKDEPSPAAPSPAPGSPPPVPEKLASTEAAPPAEAQANRAPARPPRPSASPAPRPPRRAAPTGPDRSAARAGEPLSALPRPRPFSVKLPADLLDRARNAAYWVPGVTLTGMIEEGLEAIIERLQREHNGGKPFPARRGPVRTGRPLGC